MTILIALYFAANIFRAGRYFEESKNDNEEPEMRWTWIIIIAIFHCVAVAIVRFVDVVMLVWCKLLEYRKSWNK